jgi:hypothetical protein
MASQLLIYESAVPVSASRHGNVSVEVGADYGFSRKVNSLPLMAVEFPHAAAEYAIVFSGTAEAFIPAVILGMRGEENLYLGGKGAWLAKYIPAFARRYPFVFSSSEDGKSFTLCIDEAFPGFNREGRGQRLFGEDNKPTAYVSNVLKFLEQYQVEFRRTQAFCNKLKSLALLEPMRAQARLPSGEQLALTGFMAVNRDKLKALPADKLSELAKTDELELLYLHLQSMRNFQAMIERLGGKTQPAQPAEPAIAPPAPEPEARGGGRKEEPADKGK